MSTFPTSVQLKKLVAQMEYHLKARPESAVSICQDLVDAASSTHQRKVPRRRFGKTELSMPLLTCGGMRLQQTWMPDTIPISPNRISKINASCQNNLLDCVRLSISLGVNHFETARFYGTSELQFVDAICKLISLGEIKRSDIIVQTKCRPHKSKEGFMKVFEESWRHLKKIEYIDLFSFHGINNEQEFDWVFREGGNIEATDELRVSGKIRNIGFR